MQTVQHKDRRFWWLEEAANDEAPHYDLHELMNLPDTEYSDLIEMPYYEGKKKILRNKEVMERLKTRKGVNA